MSDKPYYGYKKTPENQRRATAQEAMDANQIRYWGIKNTPAEVLNRGSRKQIEKLEVQRAKLQTKMKAGLQEHKYEEKSKRKATIARRLKKQGEKFEELGKEIKKLRKAFIKSD